MFRKKPVVIEAMQYETGPDGPTVGAVDRLLAWGAPIEPTGHWGENWNLYVATLEDGDHEVHHVASPGDWIIRGVRGEFYPIKDPIFRETYEPAGAPTSESDDS
jgi:hypothetical protein